MIPALTRTTKQLVGVHDALTGVDRNKLSGVVSPDLHGSASRITGTLTADLVGDVSGIIGDVTGLRGDVTGLSGDLALAQITALERASGVSVSSLEVKA
jgi:hypothetical protein